MTRTLCSHLRRVALILALLVLRPAPSVGVLVRLARLSRGREK